MAVSKIAVIALVAIIAVPILLGYAMNLTEVTVTDYKETGDSVNVTPLYQNGTGYTYAQADIYSLNTNFTQGYYVSPNAPAKVLPIYQNVTTTVSSLPMRGVYHVGAGYIPSEYNTFNGIETYYFQSDYPGGNTGYTTVTLYDQNNNVYAYQNRLHTFEYDSKTSNVYLTYFPNNTATAYVSRIIPVDPDYHFQITNDSGMTYSYDGYLLVTLNPLYNPYTGYVDLAAGFVLNGFGDLSNSSVANNNKIKVDLPDYPADVLMTMDLSTITASSYDLIIGLEGYGSFSEKYTLRKTTDGTGEHWEAYRGWSYFTMTKIADLYYDSSRLSNTYQIYIDNTGIEFRYVGNWPTVIGAANVYQTFRYDRDFSYYIGGLKDICFLNTTPVMRVDSSSYRAFEYPIIENQAYNPADFRTNPATTISGNVVYGSSITFGSNTYTVTDGNITLGSHKVPVKGMVLDSIPNDHGSYDNRINGTKVSESANPATITFNGKWSASIETVAQASYTYTKTEWIAGSFGWDGIDTNFLIVGLITCLGVFVALGIYARKKGSGGLIPLMIAVGCAAMVFFIML